MNPIEQFKQEVEQNIIRLGNDKDLQKESLKWMLNAGSVGAYTYNFSWLGRPIIQYPQDIIAMQELIWEIKPDLIIETGIAHGGSLIFSASIMAQLDICDAIEKKESFDPTRSNRQVVGIDVDIREHNRVEIEKHPMSSRIKMIEGSSIDPEVISQVKNIASNYSCVLVCLDSNHTHEHVLAELEAYAPLVTKNSYCVVFDTIIDDMSKELFPDRPWAPGNSPKTAVLQYLEEHPEYEIDKSIQHKLLITVAPEGFLKRV